MPVKTDSLAHSCEEFIKAGFPAIWVQSNEHEEAIRQLLDICKKHNWELGFWDADQGLKGSNRLSSQRSSDEAKKEPVWYDKKPLLLIKDAERLATKTGARRTLFILKNFHRRDYLDNIAILQAMLNSVAIGKAAEQGWCFIILSPTVTIPLEWENDFVVVQHELPDKDQLWAIANSVAEKDDLPTTNEGKQAVLDASIGMTRRTAEGAYCLSIIRNQAFEPAIVQELKAQAVKRRGLLTIYDGADSFDDMGGLANFKNYSMKLLNKQRTNPLLYPKGLLLLGIPGGGKSQAVKCLGNATGRPVLVLDVGALRSKFQGESDHNMRDALKLADAIN